jgi:hypothetical protein
LSLSRERACTGDAGVSASPANDTGDDGGSAGDCGIAAGGVGGVGAGFATAGGGVAGVGALLDRAPQAFFGTCARAASARETAPAAELGAALDGTGEDAATSEATETTAAGLMAAAGGAGGGTLFFFAAPDWFGGTLFFASAELAGRGGEEVAPGGGALLFRLSPGGTLRFLSEETMVPGRSAFLSSSVNAVCPPSPTMVALRFALPPAFGAAPPGGGVPS